MAVFVLEDLQTAIEVMVFPKTMQHTATCSPTTPSSASRAGSTGATTAQAHGHGGRACSSRSRRRAPPPVRIRSAAQRLDRATASASLKALLGEHPGESQVFLHLGDSRSCACPTSSLRRRHQRPRRRAPRAARPRRHRCLTGPTGPDRALARTRHDQPSCDLHGRKPVRLRRPVHLRGQSRRMAIEVETKDCTALGDAELARDGRHLRRRAPPASRSGCCRSRPRRGCSSPRPARTASSRASRSARSSASAARPACSSGLASVKRTSKRDAVLRAMMRRPVRRAVLAFPDEDVLVGTRFADAVGLRGVQGASRTSCPGPTTRPPARSGRGAGAWPSASASRAATTSGRSSPRATATVRAVLDHEQPEARGHRSRGRRPVRRARRASAATALIAFGWAMAEDLAAKYEK